MSAKRRREKGKKSIQKKRSEKGRISTKELSGRRTLGWSRATKRPCAIPARKGGGGLRGAGTKGDEKMSAGQSQQPDGKRSPSRTW